MLKCGFYETDITNFMGNDVPGGFKKSKLEQILDPLYAHAFALQAAGDPIVIISLDAIVVEKCDSDAIRQGISKATGIPFANISVAAVHIHTGGPVADLYDNHRNSDYCAFMVRRAVDAGIMAYQSMEAAKIGFASKAVEGVAFNRRFIMKDGKARMNPGFLNPDIVEPADIADTEFFVVRVERLDGSLMGVLTSFGLHLCTVGKGSACSADYPGQICKQLRERYGSDIGYLSLTGCCGNVNHYDYTKPSRGADWDYKAIGDELAKHAIEMMETVEVEDVETVICTSRDVTCYTRRPVKEECLKAQTNDIMTEMLRALRLPEEEVTVEVWTALIGDNAIHMLPGEMFARFGLDLKAKSNTKHTIVAELCNADIGYIYTKEAEVQGGYEASPSTYVRMNSDTGYRIVDAAVDNLERLLNV